MHSRPTMNDGNDDNDDDDDDRTIHVLSIRDGRWVDELPVRLESGDVIELKIVDTHLYDFLQVHFDGENYRRLKGGTHLTDLQANSPVASRRLALSIAIRDESIDLHFALFPSNQRDAVLHSPTIPRQLCDAHRFTIFSSVVKVSFTDARESQKITLHRGERLQLEWNSKKGVPYRIEEKRFCPVSAGLYTVHRSAPPSASITGQWSETFDELGTTYLFRLTESNQIQDILVCLVKKRFALHLLRIDDRTIDPPRLDIEQHDSVLFHWHTHDKLTFTPVEPFRRDRQSNQPIPLTGEGMESFGPADPSSLGAFQHQFRDEGTFVFQTSTNLLGTIRVHPPSVIHRFPVFGEQLIVKTKRTDLIEFEWKTSDSPSVPILLNIDANTSVVPDAHGGLTGIFQCSQHQCVKVENYFRHTFHTFETFLVAMPQYGLYNFSYSDNPDDVLLSVIVENTPQTHEVSITEENEFDRETICVHRHDRISFRSSASRCANLCRTNEFGQLVDPEEVSLRCHPTLFNEDFHREFAETGVFYFAVDVDLEKKSIVRGYALAVIVLPEIRFHWKLIRLSDFDSQAIRTNLNDFILWQFEQVIRAEMIPLRPNETLDELIACHDRGATGRNRQCIAVECIVNGTFFLANPEFERVTGSEQDRLISTIIVDPPFHHSSMFVGQDQFYPDVLLVRQNETVSWILAERDEEHQIDVFPPGQDETSERPFRRYRSFEESLPEIDYLYRFDQLGEFSIRSNRFDNRAKIVVVSADTEEVPRPTLVADLDSLTPFGTHLRFEPTRPKTKIHFTTDGSTPSRPDHHVQIYDETKGISLRQSGLQLIRAVALEENKLPSAIFTSSPTFVMESEESQLEQENRAIWTHARVLLSASIQYPNKLFGKIEVEPSNLTDLIDHFELIVDDVAQKVNLSPTDVKFSAEGFAGGEQYEIYIVAFPRVDIADLRPLPSNRRAFEIQREIQSGAPLISLAVSNDQTTIFVMWAHIGDHVHEYLVFVDQMQTKTIVEKDFNDYFGIQFHGAKQRKRYLIHVEAKLKNTNEMRKSNIIAVNPPLDMPLKEQLVDRYFAYITVNAEAPPPDMRLEVIHLDQFPQRRPEPNRNFHSVAINDGLRNGIPTIEFERDVEGVRVFWKRTNPLFDPFIQHYQMFVDGQPSGPPIVPTNEEKIPLKLSPGDHQCQLILVPKEEQEETFQSNLLNIHIPTAEEQEKMLIRERNIPTAELQVQQIERRKIRVSWSFNELVPPGISLVRYQIHLIGEHFPQPLTSDQQHGRSPTGTEHIWFVQQSPLEVEGISPHHPYKLFVRSIFHIEGLNDPKHLSTTSNEVTTEKFGQLSDLLLAPQLLVHRLGVQAVGLKWTVDPSINPSIIAAFRLFVNKRVKETLPPSQTDYQLEPIKAGSENEVQVSVSCDDEHRNEKISSPLRLLCPPRPPSPQLDPLVTTRPFSIAIQWKIDPSSPSPFPFDALHLYVDGKFHDEIRRSDPPTCDYHLKQLESERIYSISMKSFVGEKRLDPSTFQCAIESKWSNVLQLKCFLPPPGSAAKICKMSPRGVQLQWDKVKPVDKKIIRGYQIFRNGRALTSVLPVDQQQITIDDLQLGEKYSFQVLPLTDATAFQLGDQYDPEKYSDYSPGPRLDLHFADLIEIPSRIWIESITGRSAFVCWSPIDSSVSRACQPEFYQLHLWISDEQGEEQANLLRISKEKSSELLKDLLPNTKYSLRFESIQHRHEPNSNDVFLVSNTSEVLLFQTGSPPTAPSELKVVASTSSAIRLAFDPFVEHGVEIIALRVLCQPIDDDDDERKDILMDLTGDTTELVLSNLDSSTPYRLTISAITDEYLKEIQCPDMRNLGGRALKPSYWLSEQSLVFSTGGHAPADDIRIRQSTTESIDFEWTAAKAFGSTKFLGQKLRWKFADASDEHSIELDPQCRQTSIKGILSTGKYSLTLESSFRLKINLQPDDDPTSFKDISLTRSKVTSVHLPRPALPERPSLYLTGYSSSTIDLTWNRPSLFHVVDHPQRLNEQIPIHRRLLHYRLDINGEQYQTLEPTQYQCTLTECLPNRFYQIQLITQTTIQTDYLPEHMKNDFDSTDQPDETPSKKLKIRTLKDHDHLRSFQCFFEFHHNVTKENIRQERNEVKPLGKINLQWASRDPTLIQKFILRWFSSKNPRINEKTFSNSQSSFTIDALDEKHFYQFSLIVVDVQGDEHDYEPLKMPIPGEPDAPKLWLVKKDERSFVVEWSEPKSYGIPLIGFQLFIEGKRAGEVISLNLHRAEIPSRGNRTYDINICALTDHPDRSASILSQTLAVITTPHPNPLQTILSEETVIPLHIEQINPSQLAINWNTFQPLKPLRAFYVQYLCLNNQKNETLKLSKRHQQTILRDLRSGFTYEITVNAVDQHGEILYSSAKRTIQMSSPPNAPIVAIRDRRSDQVTVEWRPSPSPGQLTIVGYKVFVNNRLAAILSHDQLSYTLTNGNPCAEYVLHVQALSNDPHVTSPLSREVKFVWPGIRPGQFLRLDDGSTNTIVLAWDHPQLEDHDDRLRLYKLFSENVSTHLVRSHGEYPSDIHQAAIYDLVNGQYRVWLEIVSEEHSVRSSSILVTLGKFNQRNRKSFDAAKCFLKKQKRFRPPPPTSDPLMSNFARHIHFS